MEIMSSKGLQNEKVLSAPSEQENVIVRKKDSAASYLASIDSLCQCPSQYDVSLKTSSPHRLTPPAKPPTALSLN